MQSIQLHTVQKPMGFIDDLYLDFHWEIDFLNLIIFLRDTYHFEL